MTRVIRTWHMDSRRWDRVVPRAGDIVIATHPKCGTTWMQRIVALLVFGSAEPRSLMDVSPWIDWRAGPPIEDFLATIEAQEHRRFLKSHLPLDALPQAIRETCRIVSTGHGDPAMIPVRSVRRSNSPNRGCSSSAMNMVGTP